MAKGRLDQQQQRPEALSDENITPIVTKAGENTNEILLLIFDPTEKIYSDITGKLPVQSEKGNNYILVAYHYDANNISTTPLKNITGPCILNGITKIHDKLINWGLTSKLLIMDSEVSEDLKQYLRN